MLASRERIRKDADIRLLFKKGRKRETALMRVWFHDKKKAPFRGLVICSRKVDKRATKRNTLKRRAREILRKDIRLKLPTFDVIIDIKPGAKSASFGVLRQELLNVLLHI